MGLTEFITSTLASGVAYDLMKAGTVLTGNNLKRLIKEVVLSEEEINKLAGVYNRVLEENEIVTEDEYAELLSKNKMINELCGKYANSTHKEYKDSTVINSSGTGAVNVGRDYNIHHHHYLAEEKK